METSKFGQKEWLEICAIFFRVGVEEMMRNTSWFIILFHVNKYILFMKEASESNPLLV
jgi:hypothetical protein